MIVTCAAELLLRFLFASDFTACILMSFCFDALIFGATVALLERKSAGTTRWLGAALSLLAAVCGVLYFLRAVLEHDPRSLVLFLSFGLTLWQPPPLRG